MQHKEQNPTMEQRAWASSDSLDFFTHERRTPDDLYPSEKIFLPDAAARASSVLDVGCACGGFASIMRAFNPGIRYTGIDIVPEMLARAGVENTDDNFVVGAGHDLPFKDRAFDLVHCSGAVHLNSRYQSLIADMWRVADREALFDMRLTEGPSLQGSFRIDFNDTGEGGTLPYHVVNLEEVRSFIDDLPNTPARARLAGYRHPASTNADLPENTSVIMAFLLLQRSAPESGWDMHIES